jgi:4-amino-4-deoxy-L-arabinose transferase-like glycosyltransferase
MYRTALRTDRPIFHAVILLALSLIFFINLGASSIWDANEAFYAGTAREILETGDYVAPHFNYEPRTQKPPLTYWAIAVSYRIFGVNEFAVRFPGALAAVGILLFCYATARLLFSPRAGLIAAAITATTARIFIMERRLPIDILLLLFLSGTLYFLIRGIRTKEKRSWIGVYIFLGLGFLTKGPIAVLIPAGVFLIWMLLSRKVRFSETYPLMGCVIFIAIVLPWYLLIYDAHGWTYIAPFFLSDNLGRFATESMGPSRGPLYYFGVFATDFFPWSVLTPACIFWLWRNRRTEYPLRSLTFGILVLWCCFIFALFSLSKNKQEYYIAPLYPVAAVCIAGILDNSVFRRLRRPQRETEPDLPSCAGDPHVNGRHSRETGPEAYWGWILGGIALLLFIMFLLAPLMLARIFPDIPFMLHYALSMVLIAGAVFMAWSVVRGNLARGFQALAASLWITFIMGTLIYIPALEAVRPVKHFCSLIESRWSDETADEAGYFRSALPSMAFYLKRPIFQETDFDRMIDRFISDRRIFCILSESDYDYFVNDNIELHILDRSPLFSLRMGDIFTSEEFPGKQIILVSNKPDSLIIHTEGSS